MHSWHSWVKWKWILVTFLGQGNCSRYANSCMSQYRQYRAVECSYEARKNSQTTHTHRPQHNSQVTHAHTHLHQLVQLEPKQTTLTVFVYTERVREMCAQTTFLRLSTHNTTKYGYVHSSFSLSLISHNFMRSFEVISPALIYGTQPQIKDLIINICPLTLCKPGTPILTPSLLTRYQVHGCIKFQWCVSV